MIHSESSSAECPSVERFSGEEHPVATDNMASQVNVSSQAHIQSAGLSAQPEDAPWFVYMIETAAGRLYTGITKNVARRFNEHVGGKRGARALRGKGPLTLRFYEEVGSHSRALKLEYAVKQLSRREKLAIIAGDKRLDSC
ncbi:hypothetical protein LMG33818_002467 [Halomonadaceae bacterium LMG 33818]|uniref:GIY-YIG nuclease family protein n=1 Tax=Cernens ardua TaxID=3402176 RepID=UPI003EDC044C